MLSSFAGPLACIALLHCAWVEGNPGANRSPPNQAFCSVVDKLVTGGNYQSVATPYCSSYLSISKHTATITSTVITGSTTVITLTTSTSTIDGSAGTTTVSVDSTQTITSTESTDETQSATHTATTTVTTSCPRPDSPAGSKRDARNPKPKPRCFSSFTLSSILSSACSCLSIPPASITSTATVTSSKDVTSTTKVVATSTRTPVVTQTIVNTVLVSTTVTSTNTVQAGTTTTSTIYTSASGLPTGTFQLYDPNNQRYAFIANIQYETARYALPGPDSTPFYLDANGYLYEGQNNRRADVGDNGGPVFFDAVPNTYPVLTCSIARQADNTCQLNCVNEAGTASVQYTQTSSGNTYVWYIGQTAGGDGAFVPLVYG